VVVRTKALRHSDLSHVIVDTTVQEKAAMFPTDARLLDRARVRLVKLAKKHGVTLRQSSVRVGKLALMKHQRYAHAKHFKRAKAKLRTSRTYLLLPLRATTPRHHCAQRCHSSSVQSYRRAAVRWPWDDTWRMAVGTLMEADVKRHDGLPPPLKLNKNSARRSACRPCRFTRMSTGEALANGREIRTSLQTNPGVAKELTGCPIPETIRQSFGEPD
jgi:hypothetical protein